MLRLALIISFIGVYGLAIGQNTSSLESAFKSGQASILKLHFAKEVEINIGSDVQFLSADQAVSHLNRWFQQVKPSSFSGEIAGGSSVKYYSGKLSTNSGPFKVLVYFQGQSDKYIIDEIRIAKG